MKVLNLALLTMGIISYPTYAAPTTIEIWKHKANDIEMEAFTAAIDRFNYTQKEWFVVPKIIPEATYSQSALNAAKSGTLPCVMELDQPLVPNFAWQGYLQPLDKLLAPEVLNSLNTSGKGTYGGKVYSIGQFDVALALFTRKSLLAKLDIRTPTVDSPWTKSEFMAILDKIKATGNYAYPFDMRAQDRGEWIPYAWGPFMQSWGADFIDRNNYVKADGVLNSDKAIAFAQWLQKLVADKYITPNPANDMGFISGQVAIQYHGSWALNDFVKAWGDDLAILPVPDFGNKPVIGGGSWHWTTTASCPSPEGASAFLTHLSSAKEIAEFSKATSLIPTSMDAAALTTDYAPEGKLRMFYDYSGKFAKLRPATPAYAVISPSYSKAMIAILEGADPKTALDSAVKTIDAAIKDNNGYGFSME
jgi:multiple sugar transport system substrate-binding protein